MSEPIGLDLDAFVERIRRLTGPDLVPSTVQSFLAGTRIEPGSLEPLLRFEDGRYTRTLIHRTDAVEVLVLCWRRGSRAPIHGHEGELCWARVERGRLRFSSYRELSRAPLRLDAVGAVVEGGPGYVDGPADIHAVDNPVDFGADAVSLHVYCRPYAECDIYDVAEGTVRRVQLGYDAVRAPAAP
jgi:NitT/TauT family transport system ATP-binding protein